MGFRFVCEKNNHEWSVQSDAMKKWFPISVFFFPSILIGLNRGLSHTHTHYTTLYCTAKLSSEIPLLQCAPFKMSELSVKKKVQKRVL